MIYFSSSLSRYKRFKLQVMFRVLEWAGKTDPRTNYGLYWSTDILKALPLKQVVKMPVDYSKRFADDFCREKLQRGTLTPSDIGNPGDTLNLDTLNVTGIGNVAWIYCNSIPGTDLAERARVFLERINWMVDNGYTVAPLY